MRIRGFCCGWLEMDTSGLLGGGPWRTRVPIPSYLIEHAGSVVVFDAGLHPDFADQQSARYQDVASWSFNCELPEGTTLDARLDSCDIDQRDVDYLILSHMHFDHVGGSVLLPEAELVMQRAEWLAAVADLEGEVYMPADVDPDRPR